MEMATLGGRIRQIRKEASITLASFGARLRVSASAVSRFEHDQAQPSPQTRFLICEAFGINPAWLENGTGDMHAPAKPDPLDQALSDLNLTVSDRVLIRDFLALPPEARRSVIQFVRRVAADLSDAAYPVDHAASPAPLDAHDWSDDELHDELQRQIDAGRAARERGAGG